MTYPVHGGWSNWSVSAPCNVTCGNGTELLLRNCTNPAPKHGGTACQGAARKEQTCALNPCPSNYSMLFLYCFELLTVEAKIKTKKKPN